MRKHSCSVRHWNKLLLGLFWIGGLSLAVCRLSVIPFVVPVTPKCVLMSCHRTKMTAKQRESVLNTKASAWQHVGPWTLLWNCRLNFYIYNYYYYVCACLCFTRTHREKGAISRASEVVRSQVDKMCMADLVFVHIVLFCPAKNTCTQHTLHAMNAAIRMQIYAQPSFLSEVCVCLCVSNKTLTTFILHLTLPGSLWKVP